MNAAEIYASMSEEDQTNVSQVLRVVHKSDTKGWEAALGALSRDGLCSFMIMLEMEMRKRGDIV